MASLTIRDNVVVVEADGVSREVSIYSLEGFKLISDLWVKSGWGNRYSYTFTWMGRPIIQLPEDMVRVQELIYSIKPDVIIETGIAHGGSLIYYAGLCKMMDKGRVVGIDIEIRPHNRSAIETHPLFPYITLIEGSSTAPDILDQVKALVNPGETVLVLLDSNHSKGHVLDELNAYAPLVTPGSYILATDGIMEDLVGAPGAEADWDWNNPQEAVREFVKANPDYVLEEPTFLFGESEIKDRYTYWPGGFVKRLR